MTRFMFIKCSNKYTVVVHDLAHGTSFQKVPPSPRLEPICSAPRRFAHSMLHLHVFRDKHVVGCQLKLSCLYLKQLDSYYVRHLTVLASLFTKYSSFISHVEDAGKYALAWKGIHNFDCTSYKYLCSHNVMEFSMLHPNSPHETCALAVSRYQRLLIYPKIDLCIHIIYMYSFNRIYSISVYSSSVVCYLHKIPLHLPVLTRHIFLLPELPGPINSHRLTPWWRTPWRSILQRRTVRLGSPHPGGAYESKQYWTKPSGAKEELGRSWKCCWASGRVCTYINTHVYHNIS